MDYLIFGRDDNTGDISNPLMPYVISQPEYSVYRRSDGTARVTLSINAINAVRYQWYIADDENSVGVPINGATNGTYVIENYDYSSSMEGKYIYCEMSSDTSDNEPVILTQPNTKTISSGQDVVFDTYTIGGQKYQWYMADDLESEGIPIEGATSNILELNNVTISDPYANKYIYCSIEN